MYTSSCMAVVSLALISSSAASPTLQIRQNINCTDLTADYEPECWDQLDIPDYLNNPKLGWNVTTPSCSTSSSSSNDAKTCCLVDEAWSTCFIRLATGKAGIDCTMIDSQKECFLPNLPSISPTLDPAIAAKARYVLRNIYSINNFFTLYDLALSTETSSPRYNDLSLILGKSANLTKSDLRKAMTAGLPFWGTPSVLAGGAQNTNASFDPRVVQIFTQSIQQSKGVSSAMFDTPMNGDLSSYPSGLSYLFDSVTGAENALNDALSLIMSDMPTFLEFAAHGNYSTNPALVQVSQTPALYSAVNTYAIGQVLAQNQFSATPMPTISKAEFQSGRNCTSLEDVCQDSASHVYYWSNVTSMQYLTAFSGSFNQDGRPKSQPLLQDIEGEASIFTLLEYIETKSLAYMPVLFDGAYNCTLEGKAGGPAVSVNTDGTLDIACLSALPIYLEKGSPCPAGAVLVDGKCPFGYSN